MKALIKGYVVAGIACVAIPVLLGVYYFTAELFPELNTLYFPDATTFVWTWCLFAALTLASVTLLFYSKRWHWTLVVLVLELAFTGFFYLIRTSIRELHDISNLTFAVTFLVVFSILALVMTLRAFKMPTWKDKHDHLLAKETDLKQAVKDLENKPLRDLLVNLINLKMATAEMRRTDDLMRWREVLLEEIEEGDEHIQEAFKRLEQIKNS